MKCELLPLAVRKVVTHVTLALGLYTGAPGLGMADPTEALESTVQNCRFLGKVEGTSGYGKNAGWKPLAKHSALNRAEKMGASHVVWEQFITIGSFNGAAVARAYSCGT